ncbi:hypothetical protein [Spiroplasma endosymbiont of Glossina fuscipes fuscipes]|uniref:hypothetical protein n=1 Tax=Spiroplasma endosymbiont of Glossina fuscipes fuscipes TaxID=2004463 RepID=UPI003C734478
MAVVKYDSNQDILDLKKGTINSGNRINYDGSWSEMQNQTPATWAGEGQQPAGLTAENFVKFYRAKMSILQDTSKDLTLGTFSINFNKIVVAGLPLLASGFNDNKPLMIEIKISQTGLNTKLTNFGNIIIVFIKYYNVKLRRSGTNEFYMKQNVLDEIIAKYGKGVKSIRLNPLYSKILEDFKQSDIAKTLPDLDLLSLQDFRSYSPTVNTIISCNNWPKYIPDDDSSKTINDVEIMNKIIGKDLVGEAISEWRFLDQLVTAFKTEFDNLNRAINNEYSNFYLNTLPLSMESNDIYFILEHINFDNLAKLIIVDSNSIMGITINFNIKYQVKFKDFEQPDKIDGLVVIANDLEALSGIQKNLENYFISFIDELLKKQKYEIIDTVNRNFNDLNSSNTIWSIIMTELNAR